MFQAQAIEAHPQLAQQLFVEARAHLSREHEVVAFVVPDEQRAEADPLAPRIGEAAHDELLAGLAFHLQPMRRAAMLVPRITPFRDDPFPTLLASAFPRGRLD